MRRLALIACLFASLIFVAPASSATPLQRTGTYLETSLDASGCAREAGQRSGVNLTAWVALGLRASGRSAATAANCLTSRIGEVRLITDIELVILALVATGRNPTKVNGRNLVADLRRQIRGGRIGRTPASTQFGIFALRAVNLRIPVKVRAQLMRDQNSDGLWPVYPGGDGDSNLTASGIAAAVAAGIKPSDARLRRASLALRKFRRQGGFASSPGAPADAQSTAWVLQGLAAISRRDARAEAFLIGLQQSNGSIAYQRGIRISPVWVTAQAALGLARRPFPLAR